MVSMTRSSSVLSGDEALRAAFRRGGYVRVPNMAKRQAVGAQTYKKGYEVRFVLSTQAELNEVRRLLRTAELRPGKPFMKHSKWIQPVYGQVAVGRIRGS